MRRRVVVTGLGAVTPVGNDVATTWRALQDGVSGAAPIITYSELASTLRRPSPDGLNEHRLHQRPPAAADTDLLTVSTRVASAVAARETQRLQSRGNAAGNAGQQPLVTGSMPARLSASGTRE